MGRSKLRRSLTVYLELLEPRLQPGSLLFGLGGSLLGSSLPEFDAHLRSPDDPVAASGQQRLESVPQDDLLAALSGQPALPAASPNAGTASAVPMMPPSAPSRDPATALALPSLTSSSTRAGVSGQGFASGSTPAVALSATLATPVVAPASRAVAAPSSPASPGPARPQSLTGAGASAVALPTGTVRPATAAVVSHVTTEDSEGIRPFASLNWATYVTATTVNGAATAVAVDSMGNIFVTGNTDDGTTRTAFVAEYGSSGNKITLMSFQAQDPFLGAAAWSEGRAIAVDNAGGVYVAGNAEIAQGSDMDAFLMKFDATNQLMPVAGYGGLIGGPNDDRGLGVAVDSQGEATVTGSYHATPVETDLFAAKFTADGTETIFANYYLFTGADGSAGNALVLDSTGTNAYVAGFLHVAGGDNDILVMKIDNTTTGNQIYNETMSNPGDDMLNGIAVDQNGVAYVAGTLAVMNGDQPTSNGYVAQVSADGSTIMASQQLTTTQTGTGIALDPNTDNSYVVGSSPVFVQKFDASLSPGDSTTLSGNGTDTGLGIAYDPNSGNAYVVGTTTSSNLSTDGTMLKGASDGFLANVGSFG